MKSLSKIQIATAIALLFHLIGLMGMLFIDAGLFAAATPLHLLLMAGLIVYTQKSRNIYFIVFIIISFLIGIGVEIIGVNTGSLFGNYQYGKVLGPGVKNVPFIIGINWFIIIYCCGIAVHMMLSRLLKKLSHDMKRPAPAVQILSVTIDAATLAVLFDWLMEPVAVKLGYWHWLDNAEIPLYNYISWFVVSMILLFIFHLLPFNKENKFAINLLLIQAMFFLLLRTFL